MFETAPETKPEDRRTGVLSGIIGHELNNIAGALQGFTEIALQSAHANEPVKEYLGEMRIAIRRINALAHDLESLGELDSIRTRVPAVDCIPPLLEQWSIEWECVSSTIVDVDPLHARRALEALVQIARGDHARSSLAGGECRVTDLRTAAPCVTCDAPLSCKDASHGGWVEFRVRNGSRTLNREALREPFGAPYSGRMIRRLTLAALVHCTHRAGGHILIDDSAGSLALAFAK